MINFYGFKIDGWTMWGLVSQGVFFLSFVVQWYKSEKAKRSHLPIEFWILRLIASVMLIIYVINRKDAVFLISTLLQIVIYLRNIKLMKNE